MSNKLTPLSGNRLNMGYEMDRRGLSGSALGRRVGVQPEAVYKWLDGRTYPSSGHLQAMCDMFGCGAGYLLHREGMEDQ